MFFYKISHIGQFSMLGSLALLLILGTFAFQAFAFTFEFNIETDSKQASIFGTATPKSQVTITIWNDNNETIIENELIITDENNGSFHYILLADELSGFGNYVGEISHKGLTQKFEFSLLDFILSPLKQMKNGIPADEIICKEHLVKMYKESKSQNRTPVCVKSFSIDKLSLRGYVLSTNDIDLSSEPIQKTLTDLTLSDEIKKSITNNVINGTFESVFVGIINKDGNIEHFYYGDTENGGQPIDENTVFEIGSISKVFTSLILADMVSDNEVSLDDPIDKFLPEIDTPSFNEKKITLVDLATHTSGLPVMPNYPPNPDLDKKYEYNKAGLYGYLSDFILHREIGTQYEYSNTGGSLLGHVLSLYEGKSYEQTLKFRVLDVLGMDSTCVNQCDELRDRFAKPHAMGELADEINMDDEMAGAGGIRSSGKDMLTFLSYAMRIEDSKLQSAFETSQIPRHNINELLSIGLGWHIINDDDRKIIWHNGATNGFASFIGFDDTSKQGVVVLTNSQALVDKIGLDVLGFSFEE